MIKKIFALPVIEQISPVLSRRKLDELDLIVVDHPQVKASFALRYTCYRAYNDSEPWAREAATQA